MSVKLAVAAVAIIAGGATLPFYASGYFAHQALHNQLALVDYANQQEIKITNINKALGMYQSSFSYDIDFQLNDPKYAQLKQELGKDSLALTVNNKVQHGFMQVTVDTTFSGQMKEMIDKVFNDIKLTSDNPQKPLMTMVSKGDISLVGNYQMTTTIAVQGFSVTKETDMGEQEKITLAPFESVFQLSPQSWDGTTTIKNLSLQTGDTTFDINGLSLSSSGKLPHNYGDKDFNPFEHQAFEIQLESVKLKGLDKEYEAAKDLNWTMFTAVENNRATIDNRLKLKKAGLPANPQSQLEDVELNFVLTAGAEALNNYYKAAQQMQGRADDPQVALDMFSKVFSEDIAFKLTSAKAKTHAGAVDLTAELDVAAVAPDQFVSNPMLLVQSLTYAAKGEVPKQLLLTVAALPPELIDNLVQNDMVELKDQQLLFDMTGEKGSVNLNGKPLM